MKDDGSSEFRQSFVEPEVEDPVESKDEDSAETEVDAPVESKDEDSVETEVEDCTCLTDHGQPILDFDGVPGIYVVIDRDWLVYAPDYGLNQCAAHDKDLEPNCDGNDVPDYCDKKWCFVNAATCKNGVRNFTLFPGFINKLHFSYAVCAESNQGVDTIEDKSETIPEISS